jgi:hypothetical protein
LGIGGGSPLPAGLAFASFSVCCLISCVTRV